MCVGVLGVCCDAQAFLRSVGYSEAPSSFEWEGAAAEGQEAKDNMTLLQAAMTLLNAVKSGEVPSDLPPPDPKAVVSSSSTPEPLRAALDGLAAKQRCAVCSCEGCLCVCAEAAAVALLWLQWGAGGETRRQCVPAEGREAADQLGACYTC